MTEQQAPRPTKLMGDRIRAAREALSRSTQSAAAEAEISAGYLFKLESGFVGTPSPRVLHRLVQVLGLDYWELMGLAGYVVPNGSGGEAPAPATARAKVPPEVPVPDALGRIADALEGIRGELGEIRKALEAQGNVSRGGNS